MHTTKGTRDEPALQEHRDGGSCDCRAGDGWAVFASLDDPARLFNASLEGNVRRAIDIREGEAVDAEAFKALIRAAVVLDTGS